MMNQKQFGRATARRGFFLIMVLVVIVMATYAAYSFTDVMIAYDEAAYLGNNDAQARLLVESGVEAARLVLAQPPDMRDQAGGVYSNPQLFQAVNIVPGVDASTRGNFTILGPAMDETGQLAGIRYGLQNESARLNLNVLPTIEESGASLAMIANVAGTMLGSDAIASATMSGNLDAGAMGVSADPANLAQSLLMALPGMTVDVADAILDFIDADDEPREFGAESEYYLSLPDPYNAKNGPLDSVEELLLVRGVTPAMLFGADANRNGVIDASEQQATLVTGTGTVALGWSAYLTVYSQESNKRADGTPRIHVNAEDLETLYDDLSTALGNDEWASFIVAYRIAGTPPQSSLAQQGARGGGSGGDGGGGGGGGRGGGDGGGGDGGGGDDNGGGGGDGGGGGGDGDGDGGGDGGGGGGGGGGGQGGESGGAQVVRPWSAEVLETLEVASGGQTQLNQLLDLVGATVTVDDVTYQSPFTEDLLAMAAYMPALMANLSTQDFQTMPGRLNINECPAELIRGIPLISPEVAEAIIEARAQATETENRRYETWPLVEGLVTLQEMRLLMPLITAGGDVYRAQVVGYFEGNNTARRAEVVIDATTVNPKVTYWRDLSHLGRGFDVSVLGIRSGDAVQSMFQSATQ